MKTIINSKIVLGLATITTALSVAAAIQSAPMSKATTSAIQTVTIVAKRMTPEQKLAFDLQSTGMQTVVISAKRLTPEQKIALEQQDLAWQAATKSKSDADASK